MDLVPHGDENLYQEWDPNKRKRAFRLSLIDFTLVIIMIIALYSTTELPRFTLVVAGLAGSLLPDLISHVFPLLHEKYREKVIFRPLRFLKKNIFLFKPLFRGNDKLHQNLHNLFDYQISPVAGISIQLIIITLFLITEFSKY